MWHFLSYGVSFATTRRLCTKDPASTRIVNPAKRTFTPISTQTQRKAILKNKTNRNKPKVFAYRNLNRKGVVWSVKCCHSNLVVDRTPVAYFKEVELRVSQAGRARVIKNQVRNVHAGVVGVRLKIEPKVNNWIRAYYNPYSSETFVTETGQKVENAKYAKLTQQGLFISI